MSLLPFVVKMRKKTCVERETRVKHAIVCNLNHRKCISGFEKAVKANAKHSDSDTMSHKIKEKSRSHFSQINSCMISQQ